MPTAIQKKKSYDLFQMFVLISLLSFSVFFLTYGFIYVNSHWVLTTGTVAYFGNLTCVPISGTSSLYDCSFLVRYKVVSDDGTPQFYGVQVNNVIGPKINIGDNVYIQYDPKDPSKVIYGNTSFQTFGLLYLTIGIIILLLTVYYWMNAMR